MGNPLYNQLAGGYDSNQRQYSSQPVDFQSAMSELKANTAQMIRQGGFDVPDEIANDPRAAVMHILQSGQAKGPIVQLLQPLIRMLSGWH